MPKGLSEKMRTEQPAPASRVDSINHDIGRRIRLLREARRLPMTEIAERIGKSVGFISQVERGLSALAVHEVMQIADVLDVDFLTLITPPSALEDASPIRRAGTTTPVVFHPSGITKLPLSPARPGSVRLFLISLAPGASTGAELYDHDGEEAGTVIMGRVRLTIGTETYLLSEGDSFRFASNIPHGFGNAGDRPATALWVNAK